MQYQNANGVLVAQKIAQQDMVYNGYINAIDTTNRTLVVKHGLFTRNFSIPENCNVILKDDKPGTLDDLKIGNTVKVFCEQMNDGSLAERIQQPDATFDGTIRAIDADTRMIKAKAFLSEKKFNLADGCKIVIAGNPDGELSDLRIGDEVVFSYENVNGVLVVDRIGREPVTKDIKGAEESKLDTEALFWQTYQ